MWLLYFLTAHWIADFLCQTSYMALNKSKKLSALIDHVAVYTLVMCLFYGMFEGYWSDGSLYNCIIRNAIFAFVTFGTHVVTDYFTSRINAKLWQNEDKHDFFVMIGFDQLIHAFTLALTVHYLLMYRT